MRITEGPAGWVRATDVPGVPGAVTVRLRGNGISEIHVDGEGSEITAAHLRGLPLARILAQARSRPDRLLPRMLEADPGIEKAFADMKKRSRARVVFPVDTTATLGQPTAGLDDTFLQQVARAYRAAVARGERPNQSLAEQAQAPVPTVIRWTYLARKRGFLPPTKPGRIS